MAHDLRVKAVVRPPCREAASDSDDEWVDSNDEWVDSAEDESSSEGSSTSDQGRSETCDHPRSVEAPQSNKQPTMEAPPLQQTDFKSWGDLEGYLQEYSKETYQATLASFRVRTNNKVESRNKKIRTSGSKQPLVPEARVYYGKNYVCTHAEKYQSHGQGKRKRKQSRAIECDVQINARIQVVDATVPTFALRVISCRLEHNHPLNKHTFYHYPHSRTALEPEVADTVTQLLKSGAKKKLILQYIHENSTCAPIIQDIYNRVHKLKKQEHTVPLVREE